LAAITSPSKPPASIEHQVSTQQASSIKQAPSIEQAASQHRASVKQPATKSLSESGFIPAQKTAALLLAKTSDGPPTL